MLTSMQICVGSSPLLLPPASSTIQTEACVRHSRPNVVGMQPLPYNIGKGSLQTLTFRSSSSRFRCNAALSATCSAAGATQTVTRNARTITPDKVLSPRLDDNGPGLPPRDDDGNGGNGGGGGGNFSGGLLLLGFLGVLDILKDIEGELQQKFKERSFDQA